MSKTTQTLSLDDLLQLNREDLGDCLKQESSVGDYTNDEDEDETQPLQVDKKKYTCHNSTCQQIEPEHFHLYELDIERGIVICSHCYDLGYRFCLFCHKIRILSEFDQVLEDMYAHPRCHRNQLVPQLLSGINNLYEYFQLIGIEHIAPMHTIINSGEIDHLE